jgi:hypothetical protein
VRQGGGGRVAGATWFRRQKSHFLFFDAGSIFQSEFWTGDERRGTLNAVHELRNGHFEASGKNL